MQSLSCRIGRTPPFEHSCSRTFGACWMSRVGKNIPDGEAPVHTVIQLLRTKLGCDWEVNVLTLDALHFGLPQSRPRIWISGRHTMKFSARRIYPVNLMNAHVGLGKFLKVLPKSTPPTTLQQQTRADVLDRCKAELESSHFLNTVVCYDISRSKPSRWGLQMRSDGAT